MLRALLIDFDGVIRLWDSAIDRAAEQATALPAGALKQAAFAPDLLRAAITGQISDKQWRQQVAERLRQKFPTIHVAKAVRLWSVSPGEIDQAVLTLVRACREKVKVVLVTNATSRLPDDLAQLGIEDEFDDIINSSAVGYGKPHPEIFQAALTAAGVTAAEAFFVDDSAINVAAATQLGLVSHHYRGIATLKEELRRCDLP
jgi:putative hydrolase of the HAD superfamily